MGTALIEDVLIKTIGRCIDDRDEISRLFHDEGGPFGTFKRRILAARAFKLCTPEMEKEMEAIGEIRNQFAHALLSIDFDNPHIAEKLSELKEPKPNHKRVAEVSPNRLRFEVACWRIATSLLQNSSSRMETSFLAPTSVTPLNVLMGLSDIKPSGLQS